MVESLHSTKRVFISYSRNDTIYAEQIEQHLLAKRFQIWRDKRNLEPSQDFTGEIEAAIREAGSVVVCLTPDVQRKDSFVRREIAYALNRKKRIIPLLFPKGELPIQIATWTYIDMSKSDSLEQLTNRLNRNNETYAAPSQLEDTPPSLVEYLNLLHEWISRQLQESVHTLITLAAAETSHAVSRSAVQNLKSVGFNFAVSKATIDDQNSTSAPQRVDGGTVLFQNLADALAHYENRMLLLGEPGAGKTTVLLALAREAVVARLNDASKPIPILASIHRWSNNLPVPKWAINQQPVDSVGIFRGRKLLFILDGLDELDYSGQDSIEVGLPSSKIELQRRFIESVEQELDSPVIISCRSKEYNEIGRQIRLPGAVTLQPLSDHQIEMYLGERNRSDLWVAIKSDAELLGMARIPLLLALLLIASGDRYELGLITSQADIYDHYIHRRFIHELSKPESLSFNEQRTRELLACLAGNMYKRSLVSVQANEVTDFLAQSFIDHQENTQIETDHFLAFSRTMHFLQFLPDGAIQFIHLGLRDYLAIPSIMSEFEHLPLNIRLAAMETLLRMPNRLIRMDLIKVLNDPIVRIRCDAAKALGLIKASDVISRLIESLRSEPSLYVRREIIEALGIIGTDEAVEPICTVLDAELARTGRTKFPNETGSTTRNIPVLLISDEIDTAKLTGLLLQRLGYEVTYGHDPTHAESLAKQLQPAIAFIYGSQHPDSKRGIVSGVDVIKGILQASPLTSILMMSAGATKNHEAFDVEAIEFLNAPSHPKEIERRLKALDAKDSVDRTALKALRKIGTSHALERYSQYVENG